MLFIPPLVLLSSEICALRFGKPGDGNDDEQEEEEEKAEEEQ